jgi:hypothetical protein
MAKQEPARPKRAPINPDAFYEARICVECRECGAVSPWGPWGETETGWEQEHFTTEHPDIEKDGWLTWRWVDVRETP